jgi:hypothetical protein
MLIPSPWMVNQALSMVFNIRLLSSSFHPQPNLHQLLGLVHILWLRATSSGVLSHAIPPGGGHCYTLCGSEPLVCAHGLLSYDPGAETCSHLMTQSHEFWFALSCHRPRGQVLTLGPYFHFRKCYVTSRFQYKT